MTSTGPLIVRAQMKSGGAAMGFGFCKLMIAQLEEWVTVPSYRKAFSAYGNHSS